MASNSNYNSVIPISGAVQNYAWGKFGKESAVAQLYHSDGTSIQEKPYAELWMGTHPNGPSRILDESRSSLCSWIQQHPETLGKKVQDKFPCSSNHDLPFLFKVLSIAKALSIQAHPDKTLAAQLHKSSPENYPDPNHKPELACALNNMEALCEFRKLKEIQSFVAQVPELRAMIGDQIAEKFLAVQENADSTTQKADLKEVFSSLMHREQQFVTQQVTSLVQRLNSSSQNELSDTEKLVLRLNQQFPNDIGIFSAFLLNYVQLTDGQALFLAANEPHAYISGECVECMACSDNVVRAGLTPKFKDVNTLCTMLTYNHGFPEIKTGAQVDQFTTEYVVPIEEFKLERTKIPSDAKSYKLPTLQSASILLVFQGDGVIKAENDSTVNLPFHRGRIFFIAAGTTVVLENTSEVIALRCSCNV